MRYNDIKRFSPSGTRADMTRMIALEDLAKRRRGMLPERPEAAGAAKLATAMEDLAQAARAAFEALARLEDDLDKAQFIKCLPAGGELADIAPCAVCGTPTDLRDGAGPQCGCAYVRRYHGIAQPEDVSARMRAAYDRAKQ